MINSKDKLILELLKYSDVERLERHAEIEVAFSSERDKTEMLEKALKQSQLECAGLRSQLKNIIKVHTPLTATQLQKEQVVYEALKETIERLANPKEASDYGLSITISSKELTKEELKHIAHLLSQDIHRYKQIMDREKESYVTHHKMLVSALEKVKELANG